MKLYPRLLIWFIIIAIIPISISSLVFYAVTKKTLINTQHQRLDALAHEKISDVVTYFDDLEDTLLLVTRMAASFKNYEDKRAFFAYFAELSKLSDVFIISKGGDVVFSLNDSIPNDFNIKNDRDRYPEISKTFNRSSILLETSISDFSDVDFGIPVVFMSMPLFKDQKLIDFLVVQVPAQSIYSIFSDYSGLGESGEMLVAKKVGNSLLFVNSIRYKPDSAFQFSIKMGSKEAKPMQYALQGQKSGGVSLDYRPQPVLAIWNYLPELELGIVVKKDMSEVLSPLYRIRNIALWIFAVTLLISIVVACYLARSISKPIKLLINFIEKSSFDELSIYKSLNQNNEIGHLTQAYGAMMQHIESSSVSIDRLEEEVQRRVEAEEEKSNFFAMISHELRGPIMPIYEGVKIVLSKEIGPINEKQEQILRTSLKGSTRLLAIINDILMFRKHEVGAVKYQIEEHDINGVIYEVVESEKLTLKNESVELLTDLDKELPKVNFDKIRIEEVLVNLINNALKFTQFGHVMVISSKVENSIQVEVRDTGIGIAEEDLKALFVGYSQVGDKMHVGGAGLGLAICKKIVEAHKGNIGVRSTLDEGSSFFFTLPLA